MKATVVLMFSALLVAPLANATLGTLPTTLATQGVQISVQKYLTGSNGIAGGGGGFDGVVKSADGTISQETAFWCVDDQTYFSWMGTNEFAQANITKLSAYTATQTADPNDVAFGSSAGTWHNTLAPNGSSLDNTSLVRLEMAAYLVQQYDGFSPYSNVNETQGNADIQRAIWALTNNSAFNGHSNGTSGFNGGTSNAYDGATGGGNNGSGIDQNVKDWINKAYVAATSAGFSNLVDPNRWAVVSWVVNGSNDLSSPRQTFLVELTPEPGFYGVLAIGMSGLMLIVSRKRRAVR